jgi:hypothetical protein
MNAQWWDAFWPRFWEWVFRVRRLEGILIGSGVSLLAVLFGASFVIELHFGTDMFRLSTGEGVGERIVAVVAWTAVVLVVIGVVIGVMRFMFEHRRERRRKALMIEIRGLRSTPDTPLQAARLDGVASQRTELLFDLRQNVQDGDIVEPGAALKALSVLPARVNAERAGKDRQDIDVIVGGLAPVPFLMLTGMYLDDESAVKVADWDRDAKRWEFPNATDDGESLAVTGIDRAANAPEVVLAVSLSYQISRQDVATAFPNLPVVECTLTNPLPGSRWSPDKQRRLAQQFRDTVASLGNRNVKHLHLLLAGPASLAVLLGMLYDRRNMPPATVYQYEKSADPPYPWGVVLPTHGVAEAHITHASPRGEPHVLDQAGR